MPVPPLTQFHSPALDLTVSLPPRPDNLEIYGPCRERFLGTASGRNEIRVLIMEDAPRMAIRGAEEIAEVLIAKPNATLGLATGGTMVGVYGELVRRFQQGKISFRDATTVNLDDYYPLKPDHPGSYRREMLYRLFQNVDLTLTPIEPNGARWGQTLVPTTTRKDIGRFCLQYEQEIIKAGGIDVQLLGIGTNGHIGFNEPGSPLWSRTRVVQLTEETLAANSRFFGSIDEVPRYAITMGILTILEAQRIVLLASGAAKAEAIRAAIREPWNPAVPASALQFHPNVTVILDQEAAGRL